MSQDTIYIRFQGKTIGPLTLEKVRGLISRGQISRMHEISSDGMSWVRAEEFGDLMKRSRSSSAINVSQTDVNEDTSNGIAAPDALNATAEWYAAVDGATQGPLNFQRLASMIDSGIVTGQTLIWRNGFKDWCSAVSVFPERFPAQAPSQFVPNVPNLGHNNYASPHSYGFQGNAPYNNYPYNAYPQGSNPSLGYAGQNQRPYGREQVSHRGKTKTTAGLLALLLGGLGVHKFYLGAWGWGILYIVFIGTFIPLILSLIEAIIYFTSSDESFDKKWNLREPGPFDF